MNYFTRLAQRSGSSYERSRSVSSNHTAPYIAGENHSADISEETNTITAGTPLRNNDVMQPSVSLPNSDTTQLDTPQDINPGKKDKQNQQITNIEKHELNHLVMDASPPIPRMPDIAGVAAENLAHFEAPRLQSNLPARSNESLFTDADPIVNQIKSRSKPDTAQKQISNVNKTVATPTITAVVKNNRDVPIFKTSEPIFSKDHFSTTEKMPSRKNLLKEMPNQHFSQDVPNKINGYESTDNNRVINAKERTARSENSVRTRQEITRVHTHTEQQKLEINIGSIALEIHQKPAQAVLQTQTQVQAEPAAQKTEKIFQANRYYLRG